MTALAVLVVGCYAVWAARDVALRFVPVVPAAPPLLVQPSEVPDDLKALAAQQGAEWAQADVMQVIREKYAEYGDWNLVRRAVGLGELADG